MLLQHLIPDQMEEKGTAVREGGLLAPGNAGADGDGADRRADVMPAGPGDRPATLGGRPGKRSPVPAADGYDSDFSLTGLPSAVTSVQVTFEHRRY